jgi:hypothetical protein
MRSAMRNHERHFGVPEKSDGYGKRAEIVMNVCTRARGFLSLTVSHREMAQPW